MLGVFLFALEALCSNYPPNYVVLRSCQSQKNIEVCEINRGANNPRLEVTYYRKNSELWDQASPISLWASVNGKPGQLLGNLTAIERFGEIVGAQYTINQLKNVKFCYQATIKDEPTYAPGGFFRCPVNDRFPLKDRNATQGDLTWYYEPAPKHEAEMMEGYEWRAEFAFVNGKGNWDSRHGINYIFYFG
jgi:hypothetical protein